MALSEPKPTPFCVLCSSTARVEAPLAYWLSPVDEPAVPISTEIEESAAPVVQLPTIRTGGLGLVLASVPSELKVMSMSALVTVPIVVAEFDASVGSSNAADQVFSPVLVQVTLIVPAVPRLS